MRDALEKSRGPIVALWTATLFVLGSLACQKAAPPTGKEAAAGSAPAAAAPAKEMLTVDLVEKPAFPLEKHLESKDIASGSLAFAQLFEAGDKLFHTPYNGLDGVGMKHTVAGTPINRFSIGSVAGSPVPVGVQACGSCHATPFGAGGGLAHTRVFFDPNQDGQRPVNPRATISLFGNGVVQRLAEEMTEKLIAARDAAGEQAKGTPGTPVRQALVANGVDFGAVVATADAGGKVTYDVSQVRGISPDLVVRPFGWKGNITTVRRLAAKLRAAVSDLRA